MTPTPASSRPDAHPEPLVRLDQVSFHVPTDHGELLLLDRVDLEVAPGEAVALVGESGSGKSTTLKAISRLLPPGARTTGAVTVAGERIDTASPKRVRALRRGTFATIFQDPRTAINPLQRVGDFVLEAVRDAGGDVASARSEAVELLRRMGIDDAERRMGQHPFELSGGLLQRVMIASVLLADPDLILADEPTTALDVTTQSDVLAITEELRREKGMAMIFVTHDLDLAMSICDRVMVMYAGRVLEVCDTATLRGGARHPYTRGLLRSRPPLERRIDPLPVIQGSPIAASAVGAGCPFYDRCDVRLDVCRTALPSRAAHESGWARCHLMSTATEVAAAGAAR